MINQFAPVKMPVAEAAESSLLQAMLFSEEVAADAALFSDGDFFVPAHKRIFAEISHIVSEGSRVTPLAVYQRLSVDESSKGSLELFDVMTSGMPAISSPETAASLVKEASARRALIVAGDAVMRTAADGRIDIKVVLDECQRLILDAADAIEGEECASWEDMVDEAKASIEALNDSPDGLKGYSTGLAALDKAILGLERGRLFVIGARPGVGKTTTALSFARELASSGVSVLFESFEMKGADLAEKLILSGMRASRADVSAGALDLAGRRDELERSWGVVRLLDMKVADNPKATVERIRRETRKLVAKNPDVVVVIDSLQLRNAGERGRFDTRENAVAEISRQLKLMALELDVPVVVLSQLNRSVEARANKRPTKSDLRESGAIEQDADVILLLDRSVPGETGGEDRPPAGTMRIIVAKNRYGSECDIDVPVDRKTLAFLPRD